MKIDSAELLKNMLNAAQGVLKKKWPVAKDYAENEFRKLLEEVEHIAELKAKRKITKAEAIYLINLQRNSARMVMLTLEGLGIIAVEDAINAALLAVRETINSALGGWKLL